MSTKKLLFAVVALAAASAWAQAPVGTITNVTGVATVTTGTTGTATVVGAPIMDGATVITTSTGSVTFRLNNGCTLTVPPGHAVTVAAERSCEQLRAGIQRVTTTVQTTTTTTRIPVGATFAPGAGATAAAAALIAVGLLASQADDDDDRPLSAR